MKCLFCLIFIVWFHYTKSENVLYISAAASRSHHIWNNALAQGLVEKGYNVTVIGPEENIKNGNNYTYISLNSVYKQLSEKFNFLEIGSVSPLQGVFLFEKFCTYHCKIALQANGLQVLINYPKDFKFHLIIIDLTFGPCFLPLIHRFNYPRSVGVTPFLLPPYLSFEFGNDLSPAYQPHYQLLYHTEMNILERLWNLLLTYIDLILKNTRQVSRAEKYARKVFGNDFASLKRLQRHVSILLSNTDPVLNYAQPLPTNIIPVGGLHTRKAKELPLDLQEILDNAKHGVILFSLGSNIRSDKLDARVQSAFLEAFKERPETFLWKFESDIANLPANVIVRKWLPQNDILGHPNVKLFIGHGGALSTQEAIFHGVPMIAIPFFRDQHMNARILLAKKIGQNLNFDLITKEYVLNSLNEILTNPEYNNNMKKLSKTFKDRTETPLERGLYWIDYVLRNGGAEFLNPPSRDIKFYQFMSLDVILSIVLLFSVVIYVFSKIIRTILTIYLAKQRPKIVS